MKPTEPVLIRRRRPLEPARQHPQIWLTPSERRSFIAGRVATERFVKITRLSAELAVSPMTIRRDLKGLESDGLLVRTHGGAMRPDDGLHNGLLPASRPMPRQ
jgi:DeoR/GlpR family transcriptional regulator of sugar metabolism